MEAWRALVSLLRFEEQKRLIKVLKAIKKRRRLIEANPLRETVNQSEI